MDTKKKECGQKTEVYSRVVGYYRPIQNWNKGKKEEFDARKTFRLAKVGVETSVTTAAACITEIRDDRPTASA